ncbi:MAG: GNAT family N-acetyltransferase [Chloroflexota bacterium]
MDVLLRDVIEDDLPTFFEQHQDPEANYMAAFTTENPSDQSAFRAHWTKILSDDTIITKTILVEGTVVGHVVKFEQFGQPEVSYWLGREYWGKGIATTALIAFLAFVQVRPLYARAAKDNIGSLRVLEKCGFMIVGEDKGFANARSQAVEECVLRLDTNV